VSLLAAGGTCSSAAQCQSNTCTNGKCTAPFCATDSGCDSLGANYYCDGTTCARQKSGGGACNPNRNETVAFASKSECVSGTCGADGRCTAAAGETKPTGSGARPTLTSGIAEVDKKLEIFKGIGFVGTDAQTVVGGVIKTALGIVGSIALAIFLYGGISWMIAGGNAQKVQKARDTFIWAAIGLTMIFSSYVLVSYIIGIL
jgi:hypothetical protein